MPYSPSLMRLFVISTFMGLATWTGCGNGDLPSATTSIAIGGDGNQSTDSKNTPNSINTLTQVLDVDAPDPWIMVDGNNYFLFTTYSRGDHIPVWQSTDLINWHALGDAVPTLPSWSTNDITTTWAPSTIKIGPGDYRMVYATHHSGYNQQCLAVARASVPQGPYTNVGAAPIQCAPSNTGALDGSFYRAKDGSLYLAYRVDNTPKTQPQLYVQPAASDGLSLVNTPTGILTSSLSWEGDLLVGPDLVNLKNSVVLFYGGNQVSPAPNGIGVATATSVSGPFNKQNVPALATQGNSLIVPAGPSSFVGLDGNDYLAFHGFNSTAHSYRPLYIVPVAQLVANGNITLSF